MCISKIETALNLIAISYFARMTILREPVSLMLTVEVGGLCRRSSGWTLVLQTVRLYPPEIEPSCHGTTTHSAGC